MDEGWGVIPLGIQVGRGFASPPGLETPPFRGVLVVVERDPAPFTHVVDVDDVVADCGYFIFEGGALPVDGHREED